MPYKFKIGDVVGWNSEAGHVSGKIIDIRTGEFLVNGYTHHATKDDPQYVIRSLISNHIAHHKGDALHLLNK